MNEKRPAKRQEYKKGRMDIPFFAIMMIMLAFGLIMVFSASHASAFYRQNDSYYFVRQQALAAILGLVAMAVIIGSNYKWLRHFAFPLMIVAIVLLVLVLLIGKEVNDARRWIYIGPINFQPSEVAKLAVIVFFAHCMSVYEKHMKKFTTGVLPYVAILGVLAALLIKEPHFSGTILIGAIGMVMIFVGGAPIGSLAAMGIIGAGGLGYIIMFTNYAAARIRIWRQPESDPSGLGYQILQSLYAIGSGGLMGLGLGQSRQKYLYLPEAHNDFIFSIICEELGFIGAMAVIILFALLIWRGFVIAFKAVDKFGCLLVIGIMTLVAVQFIINIAVVTNFMPVTGMPLPFFSYGGTALLLLLCEMGIVLNVSRFSVRTEEV